MKIKYVTNNKKSPFGFYSKNTKSIIDQSAMSDRTQ